MLAPKLEVVSSNGAKSKIFNSIKRFALDGLNDLIRVLMESVDDALFELADKVDNDRERNMYFEAMREIRIKREGLQKNFDHEIQEHFNRFANRKSAASRVIEEDELTLIELDDLEDSIAIENMIKKARPHFEDDLFAVTERLKAVTRRKDIIEDDNPLDPKAICDSFHTASELLETNIQVKLIFYKLFDRFVMNNLGHFYREMNDLLIEKGVLPDFNLEQERMKQTTRFMANRIKNTPPPIPSGAPAMAQPGALPAVGGNLFAALQQAVGSIPGGTIVAGAGMPAGGVAAGSGVAVGGAGGTGIPVGGGNAIGGAVPGGAGGSGMPGVGGGHEIDGAVPGVAGSGFVAALTSLQAVNPPTQPATSIDPQSVKVANQQQLIAFKQDNHHQVTAADNQTIDVVSMLFDFFFDDEALPAPIKVLIGRLQIPILKLAIIDKGFFNHKKHPARKLLDSISRASLGWGDNHDDHKALIAKTEEIVNYLNNEFDEDISVFEKAYISFEKFLRREQQSIGKNEQAVLRKEQAKDKQFQTSQDAAAALIHRLTHNRELSFEVIDFLETIWSSVLFAAYLSLGKDSNHWRNLKRISTTFVWTLIPKYTEADRAKIIKTIPALLRALSKGMELININNDVQNRIFKMLAQEHAKIVKQTSRNIVTRVDDSTVWPEDDDARALAEAESIDPAAAPDFEFTIDDKGQIEVIDCEINDESITLIDLTDASEVIDDLNQFTAGVRQGKITVDEEIVLSSEDGPDFELGGEEIDIYQAQAQELQIGDWVEFVESDSTTLAARLSWRSNVSGNFVFVNRQGHKVRNLSINGFATELRSGRANVIQSSSVFDRAICTIMSKMQH